MKNIFNAAKENEELLKENDRLKKDYLKVLHEFKNYAQELINKKESVQKYISIKEFQKDNPDYIKRLAAIHESLELQFMLFDLKQQCVDNMVAGNVDVNLQMTGIIKGIDLVIKNLGGYKDAWLKIVKSSENHV